MSQQEYDAAIAEFVRVKGVTRCPTVCAVPTQGSVSSSDRLALRRQAEYLDSVRRERVRREWLSATGRD